MGGGSFGNRNSEACHQPQIVAEKEPAHPRESTDDKGRCPSPTAAQIEQQKISQIELFFDRERPEDSIDAVTGMGIEVVKHEEVHHYVVYKKVSDVDAGGERRHYQKEGQGDQVWRVEASQASLPEFTELDLLWLAGGAGPGPLEVNAKAGDDKEEEDPNVAKRTQKLYQPYRVLKQIVGDRTGRLGYGVVQHNPERGNTAQSINARQSAARQSFGLNCFQRMFEWNLRCKFRPPE